VDAALHNCSMNRHRRRARMNVYTVVQKTVTLVSTNAHQFL